MLTGKDIICISTSFWDRPWGSRQEIMSRLSVENRVLYVEYQMSVLHPFKYRRLFRRLITPSLKVLNKNLIIFRPFLNIPFGHYSIAINTINQKMLTLQVKRLMRRFNFRNPILWIYAPISGYLIGRLGEQFSVYHCIDSFEDEKGNLLRKRRVGIMESELGKNCDLIFVSCAPLYAQKRRLNKNVSILPSAVDEEFIKTKTGDGLDLCPEDMANIPRPRIGLIGTIDDRIDLRLLETIAAKNRDWNFIFIGEVVDKRAFRLNRFRNAHFLGLKNKLLLNSYIKNLDIGIIPYKINDFTNKISPIKLYEYLAAGKPVVSTSLESLAPFCGIIKIAEGAQDFADKIKGSLRQDTSEELVKRIEFAKGNTWAVRVEEISEAVAGQISR